MRSVLMNLVIAKSQPRVARVRYGLYTNARNRSDKPSTTRVVSDSELRSPPEASGTTSVKKCVKCVGCDLLRESTKELSGNTRKTLVPARPNAVRTLERNDERNNGHGK